jgi:hypothetical protein
MDAATTVEELIAALAKAVRLLISSARDEPVASALARVERRS